jgi:adenylate cyclase
LLENGTTAFAMGLLALPMLPAAAICAALLTGSVAQFGWRTLPASVLFSLTGAALGFSLTPFDPHTHSMLVDLLSLAFIAAYMTPIAALGYEQTVRMHRLRNALAARAASLQQVSARLARYQAPGLVRRIVESGIAADACSGRLIRRHWLTVCFVDLIGFTRNTQRLAPEELAVVLGDFMSAIATLAESHAGSIDKFLGDGVLVYFGDPDASTAENTDRGAARHDALSGVAMAAKLPQMMRSLNQHWVSQGLVLEIGVRAGLASGYCSVGDFGTGDRLDHTVIGPPVNLCSRLQEGAPGGEIWVCASTHALAGADCSMTAVGSIALKGYAEPQLVYQLTAARPHASRARPALPDVGRNSDTVRHDMS